MNKKITAALVGLGTALISYITFGVVTSIIRNPFFTRMTSVGPLENASLAITSILLGTYIGLAYYGKGKRSNVCNATATTGGIFGFLTFGCAVCNKILVFFLGVAGVLTYFEPIRPFLGILSLGLLGFSVFIKAKSVGII